MADVRHLERQDRYLTFVAWARTGWREWRVRTYDIPTTEQIEEIRVSVGLWAYPDEECEVRLLDEPYLEGVLSYEPVNGFLDCRPGPRLDYPANPSARPPHG